MAYINTNYDENAYIVGDDKFDVHEITAVEKKPEEPIVEEDLEYKRMIELMRNAYQKLDSLPLSFGLPAYSDSLEDGFVENKFKLHFKDAMRAMRLHDLSSIQEDSYDELMVENRMVYYALRRFRTTASAFFKFSTAIDGKTVDKTKVPQMLKEIMDEYEDEFKKYKGHAASLWSIDHNNLTGRANRDE